MVWLTGFLGLAAFATFWILWCQLKDARQNFVTDQRPYVWIANDIRGYPNPTMEVTGNQIVVTFGFTNFGKSPAILTRHFHSILLGGNETPPEKLPWIEGKRILPNGKLDTFSVVSIPLDVTKIQSYLAMSAGIVVYGIWQYTDSSGHRYQTEICQGRTNTGGWNYCGKHNDIKDCSEEHCEP